MDIPNLNVVVYPAHDTIPADQSWYRIRHIICSETACSVQIQGGPPDNDLHDIINILVSISSDVWEYSSGMLPELAACVARQYAHETWSNEEMKNRNTPERWNARRYVIQEMYL